MGIFYSIDWHPQNHISFIDNIHLRPLDSFSKFSADNASVFDTVVFAGPPVYEQKLWPFHAVQDTWGSQLHEDLKDVEGGIKVYKGVNPNVDSYSAFWDNNKLSQTDLQEKLEKLGVTDTFICGLAWDLCVGFTCVHSVDYGYKTTVIRDATKAITDEGALAMQNKLTGMNALITTSDQVSGLVNGRDRHPNHGYVAAQNAKKMQKNS